MRGLGSEVWRHLVRLYLSDPPAHAYLIYDLIYELDNTDLLVDLGPEGVKGYLLVWRGRQRPCVHLFGDVSKLLGHLPDPPFMAHVPPDLDPMVRPELEARGRVEFMGAFLDMVVDEDSFNPRMLERAVRLGEEHLEAFLDIKRCQGREAGRGKALRILRRWRYHGIFAEGMLVSIACAYLRLPEVWVVGDVFTRPKFRGRGYAKSVTSAVTGDAIVSGAVAMLHVREDNEPALKVYRALGYREFGKKLWYLVD